MRPPIPWPPPPPRCWPKEPQPVEQKLVQISGFGVANTDRTQCDWMAVAIDEHGRPWLYREAEWIRLESPSDPIGS